MKKPPDKSPLTFSILIIICLGILVFIFYGPTDNWVWDPSFYYAQLKSPIIDRDLDFFGDTDTGGIETEPTATGLQPSAWPLGTAILWSPFFLTAHWITTIVSPSIADGFSDPYIAFVSMGTFFYALLAVYVIYKIINRYTSDRLTSIMVCILCFAATPMFFYTFRQPITAHITTLLFTSLIVLVFIIFDEDRLSTKFSGIIFGVLLGMAVINRWTGMFIGILPIIYYGNLFYRNYKIGGLKTTRPILIQILVFIATFIVTISPQIILWYKLYGSILIIPQSSSTWITDIRDFNLIRIYFSDNRGLLTWAPFMMLGTIGIFWIKNPRLRWGSVIYVFLLTLVLSLRDDWYGGGLYGTRFFLELMPIIAMGFVSLLSWVNIKPVFKRWLLIVFTILAVLQQYILMHTIEFGSDLGWDVLKRIQSGQRLGWRFQWASFQRLINNPGSLITPRPYVGQNRQTILVNLLSGVRGIKDYSIQLTSLVIVPFVTMITILIGLRTRRDHLLFGAVLMLVYVVIWSVYLVTL